MSKLILVPIFVILLSSFAYAGFFITPPSQSVTAFVSQEKIVPINVTSDFAQTFYNLTITESTGFITMPRIESITPNQTIETSLSILTDSEFSQNIVIVLEGSYKVAGTYEPKTHHVNVSDYGFSETQLQIYRTDILNIFNNGTVTHTFTKNDFSIDIEIPVGESRTYTFNTIETFNAFDRVTSYGIIVYVLSSEVEDLVHNPDYDKTFSIDLNSKLVETNITITPYTENFSIDYYKYEEGVLEIENIGNTTAFGVELTADLNWITFSENDFDLGAGAKNILTHTIDPEINFTDQTNKTYSINIQAKGTNTNSVTRSISIFIPYAEIVEIYENMSREELAERLEWLREEFRKLVEQLALENVTPTIIYKEKEIPLNFTSEEIQQMAIGRQATIDLIKKLELFVKETRESSLSYKNATVGSITSIDERLTSMEERARKEDRRRLISTIITWSVVIALVIIFLIFFVRRRLRNVEIETAT